MTQISDKTYYGLPESRCYPEDTDRENGSYSNVCCECNQQFIGHKRRYICKECKSDE
jgi:hypothetical protein